jgi:hypothetical protein
MDENSGPTIFVQMMHAWERKGESLLCSVNAEWRMNEKLEK